MAFSACLEQGSLADEVLPIRKCISSQRPQHDDSARGNHRGRPAGRSRHPYFRGALAHAGASRAARIPFAACYSSWTSVQHFFRMPFVKRLAYYQRVFSAYLLGGNTQLSFWHEQPQENPVARPDQLGEYYMTFAQKADYRGPFDPRGVPMLDYRGQIGLQYNPIAVAQYGLGNYNLFSQTGK